MSSTTSATAPAIRATAASKHRHAGPWRAILRGPFLHFLILGSLIFAVAHTVRSEREVSERRIIVDAALRHRLVQIDQTLSGVTPDAEQLERLVDDYIDDEVLYREALRLGLDRDDEIVRRRLIQKMQFLENDLAVTPDPDEATLRAFHERHAALFAAPPSVGVEQLYFSADRGGWSEAQARARRAYDQLTHGSTLPPADDPFPFQIPPETVSRSEAARLFGDTPIVDALFDAAEGEWSAPVRSAYGWHLVRPKHRRVSSNVSFADSRAQVLAAYLQEQSQAATSRERDRLRSRYDVVRADVQAPAAK